MTGKTHKAVGVATGVAMVLYGVGVDQPLYALGMVTTALGAMLPDADHDMSKLGAARKKMINIIRTVVAVSVVIASIVFFVLEGMTAIAALKIGIVLIPMCLAVFITTSKWFRERIKFLTKHRGIMHTLIVPACMMIGSTQLTNEYAKPMLLGLALGYVSHLLADCITKAGCPLAWPVSQETVKFTKITTGTIWEYIAAGLLSIFIIWYGGIHLVEVPGDIAWLGIFLSIGLGEVLPNRVKVITKKFKIRRDLSHNLLIPLALGVIAYFLLHGVVQALVLGLAAGMIQHIVSDMFKK